MRREVLKIPAELHASSSVHVLCKAALSGAPGHVSRTFVSAVQVLKLQALIHARALS